MCDIRFVETGLRPVSTNINDKPNINDKNRAISTNNHQNPYPPASPSITIPVIWIN
ncbi:MAG: hypothetical protein K9I71_12435 [Ignavibacteriales bacterium]|nr:hypothetical protein [Ignavibacteriales bacterium]